MAWVTPKTNWKAEDFFNIQDYNRIKGNLNAIRDAALIVKPPFSFEEMGGDKVYADYLYADEINRFEQNIEHFREAIFSFPVGNSKTYYENTPFIRWEELNRIEEACRLIYGNIQGCIEGRKRLAFTLNGGEF